LCGTMEMGGHLWLCRWIVFYVGPVDYAGLLGPDLSGNFVMELGKSIRVEG
jgi:hypothetical protein